MTYSGFWFTRSAFSLAISCRSRDAWSVSTQKESGGAWKLVEGERLLDFAFAFLQRLVVEDEAVAIRGEDERDAEGG